MNEKVKLPCVAPSEYTNTSRVIHSGPCIVKSVTVTQVETGAGVCKVYDGLNNLGKLKAWLTASLGFPFTWSPGDGTDFDYGIYLELGTDVKVTVTYIPESRKAFI